MSKSIPLVPVKSSQLSAIGHDPATNTLHIQFKPPKGFDEGAVYEYQNVPADLHQALVGAESIGAHFGKTLKSDPKAFPFQKIQPPKKKEE